MNRTLVRSTCLANLVLLSTTACSSGPDWNSPLPDGSPALIALGPDDEVPDFSQQWFEREEIALALENSLAWTSRTHAEQFFPIEGVSHARALHSLERFRNVLYESTNPEEFQKRIEEEFTIYKSAGWNGRGDGVLFTAYCTPILLGKLERDSTHRYPLYALPPDLLKGPDGEIEGWSTAVGTLPYPSRGAIEAGLLEGQGLELVWLKDPIDAYLAHVNGSAFISLPDGSMYRVGYAGKNGRPYRSLGKELVEDGKIPKGEASLKSIRAWAANASTNEIQDYLSRNQSYVFFTPIDGNPHGSLDVEVITERSVATDKTLFPRGAVVFVETQIPTGKPGEQRRFAKLMFDQDTGGAIRSAGRADLYLGIGPEAEEAAGRVKSQGQMYYLFVKE